MLQRNLILSFFSVLTSVASLANNTERVQMTPDLMEVVVETDSKAQGYNARNHDYQVEFAIDPIVNGRLNLGFQIRLNRFLALDIPVSYDNSGFGQWGGRVMGIYPQNISQWSAMGGVGLKIRLTEWLGRSSFYVEPLVQLGYYSQTTNSSVTTQSLRLRPGLYFGYEAAFDSGLVLGLKLGVERPVDIMALGAPLTNSNVGFSVVPMLALGYAW